MYLSGGEYLSL